MHQKGIFIGYPTLEGFVHEGVHPEDPVYAMLLDQTDHVDPMGMEYRSYQITCSQAQGPDGFVHYCLLRVARVQLVHGHPFSSDFEERVEAAREAWRLVRAWLHEQGLRLITASIAFPKDYRLLDGRAAFLRYDKEAKTYRLAEGEEVSP